MRKALIIRQRISELTICLAALIPPLCFSQPNTTIRTPETSTLRIHATIEQNALPLNISVAIRDKNKIKASIYSPASPDRITIYFIEDSLYRVEVINGKQTISLMAQEEAARQLVEIVALCPGYFFDKNDRLLINASPLDNYTIELEKATTLPTELPESAPNQECLKAIHLTTKSHSAVIHSITYPTPLKKDRYYAQPDRLILRNHQTETESRIEIRASENNPGLPSFIFNLPKI